MNRKSELAIFRSLTAPYFRLVSASTIEIWDSANQKMSSTPTYVNTAIKLALDTYLGGYPVAFPKALPSDDYYFLLYDAASPAYTDSLVLGKRIKWDGSIVSVVDM